MDLWGLKSGGVRLYHRTPPLSDLGERLPRATDREGEDAQSTCGHQLIVNRARDRDGIQRPAHGVECEGRKATPVTRGSRMKRLATVPHGRSSGGHVRFAPGKPAARAIGNRSRSPAASAPGFESRKQKTPAAFSATGVLGKWSGRRDSNSRRPPWQGGALPTELRPQTGRREHSLRWRASTGFLTNGGEGVLSLP